MKGDSQMSESNVNRRSFLKGAAAGAAALSMSRGVLQPASYKANERIGVAFVGVGGRCQAHLDIVAKLQKENKGVAAVAVCDVWDGHEDNYEVVGKDGKKTTRHYGQGLYPVRQEGRPQSRRQEARRQGLSPASSISRRSTSSSSPRPTTGTPRCPSTPLNSRQGRLLRKADDQHHRRGPAVVDAMAQEPNRSSPSACSRRPTRPGSRPTR